MEKLALVPPDARANARRRWRWAMQKSLMNERMRIVRTSVLHSKIEKKETVAHRIDTLDADYHK